MTCFHPLEAIQADGKQPIIYKKGERPKSLAPGHRYLELPCSQCIGCRLERSRQWATRCIHEAQMHEQNCFITLTYSEENKPWDGSLNKQHFQKFMKRLRAKEKGKTIRYFHCGEYGEELQRPHYHALIFGHDFDDKELWANNEGMRLYTSEKLDKIWKQGFATIGELTWESAAYCCRYIMKKITGPAAEDHYWNQINESMQIQLQSEYTTMSLKPAIGKGWFDTYWGDCFPSDYITNKGKKFRVPKYYDKLYEQTNPEEMEQVRSLRSDAADSRADDLTPGRLAAREKCIEAKIKTLKREMK